MDGAGPMPEIDLKLIKADTQRRLVGLLDCIAMGSIKGSTKPKPSRRKLQTMVPGGLLTLAEAAARLHVTAEKVRTYVRDGELQYINVGHGTKRPRYRFSDTDIDELIEQRKRRDVPCQFSKPKSRASSIGTTSKSTVIGFTAQRNARLEKKPKKSKR
jgi:excisionase family DNA binding protein